MNKAVPALKIMTERDVLVVQFEVNEDVKILVVSIYLPPQQCDVDITSKMELLQYLLDINNDKLVVIGGDLNAKRTVWGNPPSQV